MFIRKKHNEHQCSYVRSVVSESDSNDLLMSKVSVVFFDGFDIFHHIRVIIIFIFSGKPRNVSFKMANTMFVLRACSFCFAFRILHMFSLFMLNGYFFRSVLVYFKFLFLNKMSKSKLVWNISKLFSKSMNLAQIVADFKNKMFLKVSSNFHHPYISRNIYKILIYFNYSTL